MESVREYFMCAVGACVIVGYAENLVGESFKPYVKFISGLFVVLLLFSPALDLALDFMSDFSDIKNEIKVEESKSGYDGVIKEFEKEVCESVSDYIAQNTNIEKKHINVSVKIDKSDLENIKIEKIHIVISADCDCGAISRMISAVYNAETETVCESEQAD